VAPHEFNPFAWMVAEREGPDVHVARDDPDLTEIVLGIEGPHLKFQLNGGLHAEYELPMRPGDVITSVNRLAEYREREGSPWLDAVHRHRGRVDQPERRAYQMHTRDAHPILNATCRRKDSRS
jgi:hypothetical protein